MGCQDDPTDPVHGQVTGHELVRDLLALGVQSGQTLLVHASVRSIGLSAGGASAVIRALREAVGRTGNIVVPTGTAENSMTSRADRARIARMTAAEVVAYRRTMPGFDRNATPSTTGALGEALRISPGAVRSTHPQSSFAAVGPRARHLMADHRYDCHLGEHSPLGKLYQMEEAAILLLGLDYQFCSAFHLAEYRYLKPPPTASYSCAVLRRGRRKWIEYIDVVLDDQDFGKIGESFERRSSVENSEVSVKIGNVGRAKSRLIPLVQAVDHAQDWMAQHRV